jgi:hypothetical protein
MVCWSICARCLVKFRKRVQAIVGDIDVLVQPALDISPDHQAQRPRRDRPVIAREGAVGLENARRVIGDGAAIQQVPRLTVGVDCQALIRRVSRKYNPRSLGQFTCPSGSVTSTVWP